ncbi:MAG: amdA [Frankiales bacterium]|nr:amdA [Frankiales bacterium]
MTDSVCLQPGQGHVPESDALLLSDPATTRWGWLPNRDSRPVLTITPGQTVTVDTVSHEGIHTDQGRDPIAFFGRYGIDARDVLDDAIAIARSSLRHDPRVDGAHIVTGPIAVAGALPGDLLRIDMLALTPRVSYGIVSSRHGRGALPGELPETPTVSTLCRVRDGNGVIDGGAHEITFPLRPFLGIVAVAPDTSDRVHSVPPGAHGGNIDLALLTEGSSLFLPVRVPEALLSVGDPHYAQGDGEVALTAFEAPLRATMRVSVVPAAHVAARFGELVGPYAETPDYLVPMGLDADLDVAVQHATRAALSVLTRRFGLPKQTAYAYLSAAADLSVTQVVDLVKGAHFRIPRAHFAAWTDA